MFTLRKALPLDWVVSEDYRQLILRYKREADLCFDNKAFIACQVMLGSLLEGILIYALERKRVDIPANAALENLIVAAKLHGLLPQSNAYLGQAVRDYRNFAHPAKQMKEKRSPNKETAIITRNACNFVICELKKKLQNVLPVGLNIFLKDVNGKIEIQKLPFTIGRSKKSSLYVDSEKVSKRHVQISLEKDNFYIEDLGSRNGTYIQFPNSNKPEKLKSRCIIRSGVKFRLGQKNEALEYIFHTEGNDREEDVGPTEDE